MAKTSTKKVTTKENVGDMNLINDKVNEQLDVINDATEFVEAPTKVENHEVVESVVKVDWIHRHI